MIFIENKYTKWYNSIVSSVKARDGYTEKHHIIPKCLGGTNDKSNLVKLTAREHFICHLLLVKMTDDKGLRAKLAYASMQQSRGSKNKGFKINSKVYEMVRRELSEAMTGSSKTDEQKIKQSLTMKGRPGHKHTEEHKKYIKEILTGKKKTPEHCENLRLTHIGRKCPTQKCKGKDNPMFGRKHSLRSNQIRSEKQKGIAKPKFICEHCGATVGGKSNYLRYHSTNCKAINNVL